MDVWMTTWPLKNTTTVQLYHLAWVPQVNGQIIFHHEKPTSNLDIYNIISQDVLFQLFGEEGEGRTGILCFCFYY